MIDISQVPQYTIELKNLNHPKEIVQFCRENNIESICYSFEYIDTVMKYGLQYNIHSSAHGERPYRQAWHIPGWNTTPKSSSGADMLEIVKHFSNIHKDFVKLHIWDMTTYPRSSSIFPNLEVDRFERQLIKNHIQMYGHPPIGNINLEEHMDYATVVPDTVFNDLFDIVDNS